MAPGAYRRAEVARYRVLISHSSPTARTRIDQLQIRNDTSKPLPQVALLFEDANEQYRPSLRVLDGEGKELPQVPGRVVEKTLAASANPDDNALFRKVASHRAFLVVIDLRGGGPLASGESRVFNLNSTDSERPRQGIRGPEHLFFNLPRFPIEKEIAAGSTYTTHIVVVPPPGFRLHAEPRLLQTVTPSGLRTPVPFPTDYFETVSDNVMDVSVRSAATDKLLLTSAYEIRPDREEGAYLAAWFGLLLLGCVLGVLALQHVLPTAGSIGYLQDWITEHSIVVGSAGFALGIAYLGFVTNPLTHRTKLWILLPLLLSVYISVHGSGVAL